MQMSLFPPEEKKVVELIKHTAAIHIKGNLSLVDRKVLNVLLRNAYNLLDVVENYTIRLSEINQMIGWKDRSYDKIKKSLYNLVNAKIEWNILRKDKKNEWVICSLLAGAKIADGECTYSYFSSLRKLFKNPNIYSKIDLLTQNNFKSKYSLILWEFLVDCLGSKDCVRTDWIKIADYRDLMGVGSSQYKTFKLFNFYLVNAPIEEISMVSNIDVDVECSGTGRSAEFIRFLIRAKGLESRALAVAEAKKNDETIKDKLLNFCKISGVAVDQILEKYDHDQLAENIKYIESESKRGVVKNIAPYSVNAIRNDFRIGESEKPEKKEESGEIKTLRENLKKAFLHHQLDYDIYLNGNDIKKTENGFLVSVSERENKYLKAKYSDILEKCKINLEIKTS